MNEKVTDRDARLAHEIAYAPANGNYQDALEYRIARTLTTARKEARAAAFKTALSQVKLLWSTSNSNSYNGAVNDAVRKIEAAANDGEGGRDAKRR